MEKLKSMVDISSFMLFEATGDSDELILGKCINVVADAEEEDDDDAQSCSYDDSILDCGSILERNGVKRDHPRPTLHVKQHKHQQQHHDDDDEDDDDDEGEVIDQRFSNRHHDRIRDDDEVILMRKHKKLRVCGDSNMDMINEVDKNKLFWDACLAS